MAAEFRGRIAQQISDSVPDVLDIVRDPVGSCGFERFYGFLGGESDQYYPDLVHDNHPHEVKQTPDQGYPLSRDLADRTIDFIRAAKGIAPDEPWAPSSPRACSPAPARVCAWAASGQPFADLEKQATGAFMRD